MRTDVLFVMERLKNACFETFSKHIKNVLKNFIFYLNEVPITSVMYYMIEIDNFKIFCMIS